jgi:hypothetical protein
MNTPQLDDPQRYQVRPVGGGVPFRAGTVSHLAVRIDVCPQLASDRRVYEFRRHVAAPSRVTAAGRSSFLGHHHQTRDGSPKFASQAGSAPTTSPHEWRSAGPPSVTPRHPNATARYSLTCSDDTQRPSTPTSTTCSFLVPASSNQWTVRADDGDTCYGFAPVDPGSREFCSGP